MKFLRTLAAGLFLLLALSGCSQTVSLEAAADANNPGCAEVVVRLSDSVDGQAKRSTNAQSTSAWGTPSAVIFRCGLKPVTASTLTCLTVGGVDWLVDESQAPNYRFVTFGRVPTSEVIVDSTKVSGSSVLDELAGAVNRGRVTNHCL